MIKFEKVIKSHILLPNLANCEVFDTKDVSDIKFQNEKTCKNEKYVVVYASLNQGGKIYV